MAFSLDEIEDGILDFLRSGLEPAQQVYDDYIPNTKTLRRNQSGEIVPYVVVQFGDLQPRSSYSMVGPRGGDYELPVYAQCISADPRIARRISNKVVRLFLGETFPWAGDVRKRPGFNMFTIDSSDSSVEAYSAPTFFAVTVQVSDEA